jgi:hypothetical protein
VHLIFALPVSHGHAGTDGKSEQESAETSGSRQLANSKTFDKDFPSQACRVEGIGTDSKIPGAVAPGNLVQRTRAGYLETAGLDDPGIVGLVLAGSVRASPPTYTDARALGARQSSKSSFELASIDLWDVAHKRDWA